MEFKRGDQIIYIPSHADGPDHKDSEEGFVTSVRGDSIFCRYWSKHDRNILRTLANSEATSPEDLILADTRHQNVINNILKGIP